MRLLMRYKVQDGSTALLLRFKPKARQHWQALKDAPDLPNGWMGQECEFEADDSGDAFMTLECAAASRDAAYWPAMYDWLASKLELVHRHALPWLREAIGVGVDDDDDASKPLTPTRQRQLGFWKVLVDRVEARSDVVRPQKPAPQSWINVSIGRAGFGIIPTVNQQIGRLGVQLMIASKLPKQHYQMLLSQKDHIEQELGFAVEWLELPDAHQSQMVSWRNDSPLQDEARWDEYAEWMADRIVRMDAVLRPLVKALP